MNHNGWEEIRQKIYDIRNNDSVEYISGFIGRFMWAIVVTANCVKTKELFLFLWGNIFPLNWELLILHNTITNVLIGSY